MRVLVCGGRDFRDAVSFETVMRRVAPSEIISGGATGADELAVRYATRHRIDFRVYYAHWGGYPGNSAGPIRNQRMLDEARPDLVVAFPGGVGTADMMARAEKAGVPVQVVPSRE